MFRRARYFSRSRTVQSSPGTMVLLLAIRAQLVVQPSWTSGDRLRHETQPKRKPRHKCNKFVRCKIRNTAQYLDEFALSHIAAPEASCTLFFVDAASAKKSKPQGGSRHLRHFARTITPLEKIPLT
jgi:hypothetical protein